MREPPRLAPAGRVLDLPAPVVDVGVALPRLASGPPEFAGGPDQVVHEHRFDDVVEQRVDLERVGFRMLAPQLLEHALAVHAEGPHHFFAFTGWVRVGPVPAWPVQVDAGFGSLVLLVDDDRLDRVGAALLRRCRRLGPREPPGCGAGVVPSAEPVSQFAGRGRRGSLRALFSVVHLSSFLFGSWSEPGIERLGLEREDAECGLVHPPQRRVLHELLEALDAECELAQRQRHLAACRVTDGRGLL